MLSCDRGNIKRLNYKIKISKSRYNAEVKQINETENRAIETVQNEKQGKGLKQ